VEVAITTDQQIYKTRQAVEVTLDLQGLAEEELANLSLSVTDQAVIQTPVTADNIQSWLLLNSDLKGAIEQPGYYFTEPMTDERRRLLDLLLLTQGWRRFVWQEVLGQDLPRTRYEAEDGIYIAGTATKWQKPEQPVEANVVLSFLDGELYMEDQTTSADGTFEFGPYFFPDTASIILQARIPKKTTDESRLLNGKGNTSIYLAERNDPPVQWPPTRTAPLPATADFLATSQQAKITDRNYDTSIIDLDGVTVTAKRQPKDAYREISQDHGTPTNRLPVADDPGMTSLPNIYQLFGRIPGVQVRGEEVFVRGQTPQFILDGIPISTGILETLLPSEILVIDVYKGADLFFGSGAGLRGNVIAIHTRQARDVAPVQRNQAGIEAIEYPGFYLAREFYSPNYAQRQPEYVKPDYRTTLFWAPELRLEDGTATITFYTSDQPSTYQIEVEGMTSAGRVVRGVQGFEVR